MQDTTVSVTHAEPLLRIGIAATLRGLPWVRTVEAQAGSDAQPQADIVVSDYALALQHLMPQTRSAPAEGSCARYIVVTGRCSELEIRTAVQAGVAGFVLQSADVDEFVAALQSVRLGMRYLSSAAVRCLQDARAYQALTARESEVLGLLGLGCTNKRICSRLGISMGTAKSHVHAILAKLDARTRTEAIRVATHRGLIAMPAGQARASAAEGVLAGGRGRHAQLPA